jgi:hypothetical protein
MSNETYLSARVLKDIVNALDDDTLIGVTDHFGNLVPFDSPPEEKDVLIITHSGPQGQQYTKKVRALIFERLWVGEEPD